MNKITGFEMATTVQRQMKIHFSFYQVNQIQIIESQNEPMIEISLIHKLNQHSFQLSMVAEKQENNPHNVHLSLFNNDPYFIELYKKNRTNYVKRNHEMANEIINKQLVPENLYLIQDADGKPGVDFIKIDSACDAINLITTISNLFKN